MNNSVNIISTGNVKVNTQSSTRNSVKVQQNQQGDFSQTLDQAQQARSKNASQSYDSKANAAKEDSKSQENITKDDAAREKADAADIDKVPADKEQAIGSDKDTGKAEKQEPAAGADSSDKMEADGDAVDEAAAQILAAGAEASLNMVQNLPLVELTSYFRASYGENAAVQQTAAVQQAAGEAAMPEQVVSQLLQGDGQQPLDSLQAVNIMEEVQPLEGDTQDASARTPLVKAQQANSYAPSSIEALLGNSRLQNQQGAGGVVQQQDNGQQMLNLLAGRQVYTQPADKGDTVAGNTVNAGQLADFTGTVEVVSPAQEQQSFAGAGENSSQQQSMTNSQGQQQASQMAGEAAFDVVLPGDEPQENTMGQNSVQAMGFQQVLDGSQGSSVQGTNQSQQANANQAQETYNVPQQIVEQAKLLQRGTDTEMVIKLNPEHLGQLSLKVSVNGNGGVTATFHTDNAQVRAILENTIIQLKQQLNEQGIKVDNVDVQTGLPDGQLPQDQGQQGFYQGQQGQQVRSAQVDLKDFEETSEALAAEPVEAQGASQEIVLDSQGNQISTGVNYTV